jgi:hypothetical protein
MSFLLLANRARFYENLARDRLSLCHAVNRVTERSRVAVEKVERRRADDATLCASLTPEPGKRDRIERRSKSVRHRTFWRLLFARLLSAVWQY